MTSEDVMFVKFHCFTICRVLMVQEEVQVLLETLELQVHQDFRVRKVLLEALVLVVLQETVGLLGHQDHRDLVDHPEDRETLVTVGLRDPPDHRDSVGH